MPGERARYLAISCLHKNWSHLLSQSIFKIAPGNQFRILKDWVKCGSNIQRKQEVMFFLTTFSPTYTKDMCSWTMKRKLWRTTPIRGLSLDSGPFTYQEPRGPDQHFLVSTPISFSEKNNQKNMGNSFNFSLWTWFWVCIVIWVQSSISNIITQTTRIQITDLIKNAFLIL